MQKPKVEHIEGLSPAVAIEQKHSGHSPRSTVGTVTEIYDYLRILMSRLGQPHCPDVRRADRQPIGRRDHRQDHGPSGRHEAVSAGAAGNPRRRAVRNAVGRDAGVGLRAHSRRRADLFRRPTAADRPAAETRRRGGDRPRDGSRRRPARGSPAAWRTPCRWAAACCAWSIRARTCRSRNGRWRRTASTSSATVAGGVSSRFRRTISRSTARWAGARRAKGWACRPARIRPRCCAIRSSRSPKAPWRFGPAPAAALFAAMLEAFSRGTGIPTDVPSSELGGRHRRLIFHGTGDQWFDVRKAATGGRASGA